MPFRPFFEWCDQLAISNVIRDSRFLFPIIESVHILALAVMLGMVILFSMRLLGLGLRGQAVPDLYATISGLRNWALVVMLVTGALLFCSEAMKCYDNPPFWAKMISLGIAIIFQYTVVRSVASRVERHRDLRNRFTGLASLVLWFGVGVAGRAIGFY
jgi:uncharacterized protein DUF6644